MATMRLVGVRRPRFNATRVNSHTWCWPRPNGLPMNRQAPRLKRMQPTNSPFSQAP